MIQLILIIVETGCNSSTDAALLRCGTRPVAFLPQAIRLSHRFGAKPLPSSHLRRVIATAPPQMPVDRGWLESQACQTRAKSL
jgi:hypothetical protein